MTIPSTYVCTVFQEPPRSWKQLPNKKKYIHQNLHRWRKWPQVHRNQKKILIPSLKLTFSPLKIGGLEDGSFPFGAAFRPIFRGKSNQKILLKQRCFIKKGTFLTPPRSWNHDMTFFRPSKGFGGTGRSKKIRQPTPPRATYPPPEIAGLIKGNQWLISPDHKAGYFWGGTWSGGVGWPAMMLNFGGVKTTIAPMIGVHWTIDCMSWHFRVGFFSQRQKMFGKDEMNLCLGREGAPWLACWLKEGICDVYIYIYKYRINYH